MVKRSPVSAQQNKWFNSQVVDDTDLTLEQDFNTTIQSGLIDNHIGTGVLPEVLEQNILFDSSLTTDFLDGKAISIQNQPNDNNLGNQLEITLSDSLAAGKKAVKICIIGLDFQENLQYETFIFKTNETQASKKHFANILVLLFNDFFGKSTISLNLGGTITIKEAKPMTLSRDALMVSQDIEPNLFFRDFFLDGSTSLQSLLQNALPLYNIDDLKIFTDPLDNKVLFSNDVVTQIGQKFQATTNNIQKVSLLLSVRNLTVGDEDDLSWTGDLVISIYPLQSNIDCPSDFAPNLPIEFAPSNIPLAQISFNYASLQDTGIILDSVPQPVDFVFSNTPLAAGTNITVEDYYAISIKRSGSADKCDILIAVGNNNTDNSRITTFTGTLWVDIPEQDLWFRIYTDAGKISDGQAYENGHGIIIEKTTEDATSLTIIDNSVGNLQFTGNNVFSGVVSAITQESDAIPDQRTGNPVFSRQQFTPQVQLLNSIDLSNLQDVSDPLVVGTIVDKNKKFFDAINSIINSKIYSATIVNNEIVIKIIDDATDTVRYDTTVNTLSSNLLNGDFIGAKFILDTDHIDNYYRIADAKLCSMISGDVNGNGVIDDDDIILLNTYLNYDLNVEPPENSIITTNGSTTTFNNGYTSLIAPFKNAFSINFQLVNPTTNAVVASASNGILVADTNDNRKANFTSSTIIFSSITNLSDLKLVILDDTTLQNYGGFDLVSLDTTNNILTIRKVLLTGDVFCEMLRADVDGDFHITTNDSFLLQNYIDRATLTSIPTPPFPAPTSNAYNKIGKRFNVLRFELEKYIDRADDYSSVGSSTGRIDVVHPIPDLFMDGYSDGYTSVRNTYTDPYSFQIVKKLTWDDVLITVNSNPREVPCIFGDNTGFVSNSCNLNGVICTVYESQPDNDPGVNNLFAPNDLILGVGDLKRPDGNFYKVDYEVGTIILDIPTDSFDKEYSFNVFESFVYDYTTDGLTKSGYKAMRFSDCSTVQSDALTNNQVRFDVAMQSFSPNIDGYTDDGYSGVVVDGRIGVNIDSSTGIITMHFTNLYSDPVMTSLNTRVQINVMLKKAGFNNERLEVSKDQVKNLLGLTT